MIDNRKRTKSFVLLANEAAALQRVVGYIKHGTAAFVKTNLALSAAGFATFALLYCVQPLLPALSIAFGVTPPSQLHSCQWRSLFQVFNTVWNSVI